MTISISLMTKEDVSDVLNISLLSLNESFSEDAFLKELSNPVAKYLVAKSNNVIVGFIGIWTILDEAHIMNIAVHPQFRNRGIGSLILEFLISKLESFGLKSITLEVRSSNIVAQSLYEKYGFKEEGIRKRYYSNNKEDAIIMWYRSI